GDDLPPEDGDLRHHLLLQGSLQARADLPERDTVVLQVEHRVRAALELAGLRLLDRVEDPDVYPLHRARQDVRSEERLVAVDSDREQPVVLGGAESAEAAEARNAENNLRSGLDLVLRDVLAEVLLHEVL